MPCGHSLIGTAREALQKRSSSFSPTRKSRQLIVAVDHRMIIDQSLPPFLRSKDHDVSLTIAVDCMIYLGDWPHQETKVMDSPP